MLTTTLNATTSNCEGGVCMVDLDKLAPSKGFEKKNETFIIQTPRYVENNNYAYSENIQEEYEILEKAKIDKSFEVVVNNEKYSMFPSYTMTEEEKIIYVNEKENNLANQSVLVIGGQIKKIERTIIEKTELPVSEYYCEKDKYPVYDRVLDAFECV